MNIEAATNEIFRYTATLHNGSPDSRVYELKTDLPAGWQIAYRVEGSQVRSLNLEGGKSQDISIEVNATASAKPDKYLLPVKAVSQADTLQLNLEAVVKGSYSLELTTPTGRLSDEITSGSRKDIQLVVKNSGTLPLNDLELSGQLPPQWESTFEPAKIQQLEPGKTTPVTVTVKVPDKTIAGDYAGTFSVKNTGSSAQANFRMVVTTSLLSGWIGCWSFLLP
ncbi:NEW3 domain-containing protein [Niabella sp. W65]|nr:NEW3 domain-containing protein [Niabella sp. W65]MCH7366127.1 NEW3 domain-containing protein [Niabella sp. W65]